MPYIKTSNANIFYEEVGNGEPIIFLHNAFSRGIIAFSAQIVPLQAKYRCILPDLRGHGRTTSEIKRWTIPELAEDIKELMDNMSIKNANVIGFSMGGGVALYLASKYPERIKSLITIGTASSVTNGIKSNADNCELHILKNEEDKGYIELLKRNHFDATLGDWKVLVKNSVDNWRAYPDLTVKELNKITARSIFICGEEDEAIKKEHLIKLQEGVINSKIEIITECSHGPHLIGQKPEELNKMILEFLKENI